VDGRPARRSTISGAVGMTGLEAFRSRGSQRASRIRKYFAVSSSGKDVRVRRPSRRAGGDVRVRVLGCEDEEGGGLFRAGHNHPGELERNRHLEAARRDLDELATALRVLDDIRAAGAQLLTSQWSSTARIRPATLEIAASGSAMSTGAARSRGRTWPPGRATAPAPWADRRSSAR
jgi:hypothetical protein